MKKIASILILAIAFTLSAEAQGKREKRGPKLTIEQHTDLTVKRMILSLELSEKQQKQIEPLIQNQVANKRAAMLKRKENKATKKRPSSDEMYAMKSMQLDNQIAFRNSMKDILNKKQFEKFEKMKKSRKMKGMKMVKKRKMLKKKKKEKRF